MFFENDKFQNAGKTITVSVTISVDELAGHRMNMKRAALALGYLSNVFTYSKQQESPIWVKEITIK